MLINSAGVKAEVITPEFKNLIKLGSVVKKVGKTTRSCRYDLNQIPQDYTMEVMNRFKGLDLVDRMPEELWTEVHNIVQEAVTKTIPKKKKCNKQSHCLKRLYKQLRKEEMRKTREKGKYKPN